MPDPIVGKDHVAINPYTNIGTGTSGLVSTPVMNTEDGSRQSVGPTRDASPQQSVGMPPRDASPDDIRSVLTFCEEVLTLHVQNLKQLKQRLLPILRDGGGTTDVPSSPSPGGECELARRLYILLGVLHVANRFVEEQVLQKIAL
jgi:hypothetical protein